MSSPMLERHSSLSKMRLSPPASPIASARDAFSDSSAASPSDGRMLEAIFVVGLPLSQVPCTIAAYQQAHALGIGAACAAISRTGIGFFAGLTARTASLAGSLFVFPFTMEELQPVAERLFPQR